MYFMMVALHVSYRHILYFVCERLEARTIDDNIRWAVGMEGSILWCRCVMWALPLLLRFLC